MSYQERIIGVSHWVKGAVLIYGFLHWSGGYGYKYYPNVHSVSVVVKTPLQETFTVSSI